MLHPKPGVLHPVSLWVEGGTRVSTRCRLCWIHERLQVKMESAQVRHQAWKVDCLWVDSTLWHLSPRRLEGGGGQAEGGAVGLSAGAVQRGQAPQPGADMDAQARNCVRRLQLQAGVDQHQQKDLGEFVVLGRSRSRVFDQGSPLERGFLGSFLLCQCLKL